MASVNKVMLIGHLGDKPKIANTSNGVKIATMSIATGDTWKDKATGEKKERTEWHRVVIYNPALAEISEKYLKKGSKVFIEGQLQTRKWEDTSGVERYSTEVVLQSYRGNLILLDSNKSENWENSVAEPVDDQDSSFADPDLDDDIPF